MEKKLQQYSGGIARAMFGIGPKPVFAPPGEGNGNGQAGEAGEGDGDNNGDGGDDAGDGKGADGDGKPSGDAGNKLARSGLFGKAGKDGGSGGEGNGDGGDEPAVDADGRPKGLADKFWNAKDKTVNVDALLKSHSDTEKALGELKRQKGPGGGEVPKEAKDYFAAGITVPEAATNFKGLGSDDPGVKSWADVCKDHGIGKDLANKLMSDMLVKMNDHAPVPIDPDEEFKSLGKNAANVVDGVFTWIDGMATAGDLSEDDVIVVTGLSETANGIRFLAKMRNLSGEKPIPINPGGGVRGMSIDQLDEAYKAAVVKGDYKEQARLDALRDQINPDGA